MYATASLLGMKWNSNVINWERVDSAVESPAVSSNLEYSSGDLDVYLAGRSYSSGISSYIYQSARIYLQ